MKRRALILLLVLVMLLSMVPMSVFAASDRDISASCVSLIKYFEGFRAYPYWDYSQYTVGYGTRCPDDKLEEYLARGITEAEAEALLYKELAKFEDSVNDFDAQYDLNLTQYEFDALVSFTYNLGAGWMRNTGNSITKAVIEDHTGNDLIFAMTQWCVAGGSISTGLVQRRLIEANLYLNGVYSTSVPSNYDYVLFNHSACVYEGTDRSIRIQGYDSNLTDEVRPIGKKSGYRFLGWYTAENGGEWITTLTSAVAGKTLYAHWQSGEGDVAAEGTILGTVAKYERTAQSGLKAYAEPSETADVLYTLEKGAVMTIVADYVDANGVKWGKLADGCWVCLDGTGADNGSEEDAPVQEKVIATGTISVSSGYLNVRAGAGSNYAKVGSLAKGARVEIYEIVTVSGTEWGRISNGWICMDYVTRDKVQEEPSVPTEPETTEPPTTEPPTTEPPTTEPPTTEPPTTEPPTTEPPTTEPPTTEPPTTEPPTTEPPTTEPPTTEPPTTEPPTTEPPATEPPATEPETKPEGEKVIATGTINLSSGYLNVRAGAGSGYAKVGSLAKGAKVEIYEIVTVSGTKWGRISNGWISMTYVKIDSTATETGKTLTGTVTASALNVRSGAGTGYSVVATYQKGAKVTIYETTTAGSITWGRTNKGWISMAYIKLDTTSGTTDPTQPKPTEPAPTQPKPTEPKPTEPTVPASGRTGTTTSALNVRKGAGTGYAKVATISNGAKVTITEMKLVSGSVWGKISNGWICLDYVKLNAPTAGSPAMVTASTLNIRSGAGTGYSSVGSYTKGTMITILETKKVGTVTWGRTAKGWISLAYVL